MSVAEFASGKEKDSLTAMRARLLSACRTLALEEGFASDLPQKALRREGFEPELAPVFFPGGAGEIVLALAQAGDAALLAQPQAQGERLRQRVEQALMARLAIEEEAFAKRLVGFFMVPPHLPLAMQALASATDAIWRNAGDRPQGFDFYTKRGLLMPVVASTALVWLQDEDENKNLTRRFARRHIAGVENQGRQAGQWLAGGQEIWRDLWQGLGRQRYDAGSSPNR